MFDCYFIFAFEDFVKSSRWWKVMFFFEIIEISSFIHIKDVVGVFFMLSWWCNLDFYFLIYVLYFITDIYSGDINHCYFIHFLLVCVCLSLYNYIMNKFPNLRSFYSRKMTFLARIFQFQKKIVRYFVNDCRMIYRRYYFLRTKRCSLIRHF